MKLACAYIRILELESCPGDVCRARLRVSSHRQKQQQQQCHVHRLFGLHLHSWFSRITPVAIFQFLNQVVDLLFFPNKHVWPSLLQSRPTFARLESHRFSSEKKHYPELVTAILTTMDIDSDGYQKHDSAVCSYRYSKNQIDTIIFSFIVRTKHKKARRCYDKAEMPGEEGKTNSIRCDTSKDRYHTWYYCISKRSTRYSTLYSMLLYVTAVTQTPLHFVLLPGGESQIL